MLVIKSEGSSPGRKGFKMVLAQDGEMFGSIGGGIMEHKLVELSKMKLKKADHQLVIKNQIHSKSADKDRSGMICSGQQTVAIIYHNAEAVEMYTEVLAILKHGGKFMLNLDASGITLNNCSNSLTVAENKILSEKPIYQELIGGFDTVHIFGAGHVALELSFVLKYLDYYIMIYDDRTNLNTLNANSYADEKIIVNYDDLSKVDISKDDFVVIVSFGYKTDKVILRQLVERRCRYLGMMGSAHKTKTIMRELSDEGIAHELLDRVLAPIGYQNSSKTPKEIAVSIAAQLTHYRNQ